jgi:hypothetical protein
MWGLPQHRNLLRGHMPIPLPQPFMVVPVDGSDPVHIHEWHQDHGPALLGVTLVTPYIAQKWLHAGQPTFYPVVIQDTEEQLVAGQATLREAVANPEAPKPAAVIKIGTGQAETAVTAVAAMRQAYDQPERWEDGVEALILSQEGGRVLGGAQALWELRRPRVMLVLIIPTPTDEDGRLSAAPMN